MERRRLWLWLARRRPWALPARSHDRLAGRRLGWRVHRLWSTSWFTDPDALVHTDWVASVDPLSVTDLAP